MAPDGAGIVLLTMGFAPGVAGTYKSCTGTLVTNDWVLTAKHCMWLTLPETFSPDLTLPEYAASDVRMFPSGGALAKAPSTVADRVITNPDVDIALVHLSSPAKINGLTYGFARPLHNGATSSIGGGAPLACYGYGVFSDLLPADGLDHVYRLRAAALVVKRTSGTTYTLEPNIRKQMIAPGDSGGPCFVRGTGGAPDRLAGVHSTNLESGLSSAIVEATDTSVSALASWIADRAFQAPLFAPAQDTKIADTTGWDKGARMVQLDKGGVDWVLPSSDGVNWMLAKGDGTFEDKAFTLAASTLDPNRNYFADVDNDGVTDWIQASALLLRVRLGIASASKTLTGFRPEPALLTPYVAEAPDRATFADVDGDHLVDAIFPTNTQVLVFPGLGDGTFGPVVATDLSTSGATGWLAGSSFANVDGFNGVDWVFRSSLGTTVRVGLTPVPFVPKGSLGAPGFSSEARTRSGTSVIADVNGDGRADFVDVEPTEIAVYLGQPLGLTASGYFSPLPVRTPFEFGTTWASTPEKLSLADVNGDGCADFVFRDLQKVWIKPSDCNGTFGAVQNDDLEDISSCGPSTHWYATTMADVTGDSKADLVNTGSCRLHTKPSLVAGRPVIKAPVLPPPLPFPLFGTLAISGMTGLALPIEALAPATAAAAEPAMMQVTPGTSIGGQVASTPAVATWGQGRLDTFYVSPRGTLLHRWSEGGQWSGEEDLGGHLTSAPAVVAWAPGRLDIVARGEGNTFDHLSYQNGWSQWTSLPGNVGSAPAITSWGPGRLDAFYLDANGALRHRWYAGGWSGEEWIGGSLTSAPAAVSWGYGRIDIFARGRDMTLNHMFYDQGWSGWESWGGQLTSSPAVSSFGVNTLDIFYRGTDLATHRRRWDWGLRPEQTLLDSVVGAPAAVASPNPRAVDLLTWTADGLRVRHLTE